MTRRFFHFALGLAPAAAVAAPTIKTPLAPPPIPPNRLNRHALCLMFHSQDAFRVFADGFEQREVAWVDFDRCEFGIPSFDYRGIDVTSVRQAKTLVVVPSLWTKARFVAFKSVEISGPCHWGQQSEATGSRIWDFPTREEAMQVYSLVSFP